MAGKHRKNAGYIDLTRDEYNIVTAQKVVEGFWFRDPKGWWQGPDGVGPHPTLGVEVPYLRYPGIREAMIAAGVDEPYLPAGDWLLAEYVHESQMPRCTPTAINGFVWARQTSRYCSMKRPASPTIRCPKHRQPLTMEFCMCNDGDEQTDHP